MLKIRDDVDLKQSRFSSEVVIMSEEEKMKIAVDLAKQGIDLEKVERIGCELTKLLQPVVDLAMKNKKILDKYDKKE